ncbi:GGDEF domain-containing protein [Rhodopirellula europaea]|uniref:diguanylate cyclase n=1 Tax=Rhodopirellula europaea SH398 TaxID=1263868 RepID=M5SIN7_9BACT|nr:GGDEF domain-containing protein [Rhodopirellula europaea]EMI27592.1 diguanylate cyclase [Rhodopirellula europaea SH398]
MNPSLIAAGFFFAAVLIAIGYLLGRRRAKVATAIPQGPIIQEDERQRMLGLLEGLSRWTNEYSGNVSNYQSELGELSDAMRISLQQSRSGAARNGRANENQQASDARMVTLINQIMSTNTELQTRLEAAEQQLEEQTEQIQSYLTEARTDGLTGLFNRRAFDKKLDELFSAYRAGGKSFTLILMDIDHFKMINDTHGHPIGDIVLQQISQRLGHGMQDAEIVSRFGGEEFAILTHLPIRAAADKVNKLRDRIANDPIDAGSAELQVTLSVGLSTPQEDLVIGPIVRRADEALYSAKNMGRNRVYFNDGNGAQLINAPEVIRS